MTSIVALGNVTVGLNLSVSNSELRDLGLKPCSYTIPSVDRMEELRLELENNRGSLLDPHNGDRLETAKTQDNLLIFYILDRHEWEQAVARMVEHGFSPVESYNPYWDVNGKTFEDTDGYRVVLQQTAWG